MTLNAATGQALTKVPEITLTFWIIKIAATTLGETGGDAVTMSMDLGYLVGTGIFAAIFLVAVLAQIKAESHRISPAGCAERREAHHSRLMRFPSPPHPAAQSAHS